MEKCGLCQTPPAVSVAEDEPVSVILLLTVSLSLLSDHSIDFMAMDVAVNAVAGALKAFFADLPDPLIPYSLHPELLEASSKVLRWFIIP